MSETRRLVLPQPISTAYDRECATERGIVARLEPGVVMMQGDNPALAQMPAKPTLLDFFRLRFGPHHGQPSAAERDAGAQSGDIRRRSCSPACCTTSPMACSFAPITAIGARNWWRLMSTRR